MSAGERELGIQAQRICSEDDHGAQLVRVWKLPEGGGGYAVEISIPPMIALDDPIVLKLRSQLEAIPRLEHVLVTLAVATES